MSRWDEEDDFPWFGFGLGKRKRLPFFDFGLFRDFDEFMERMMHRMARDLPKDLYSEKKLGEAGIERRWGPYVYGYSITIGPDGKPVIREFGNVKSSKRPGMFGMYEPKLETKEAREPLVDVIEEDNQVKVVAELPGVDKSDIKLETNLDSLRIDVETPKHKYHKEIELPSKVDPDSAKASYVNGVLEVSLSTKKLTRPKGKEVRVE